MYFLDGWFYAFVIVVAAAYRLLPATLAGHFLWMSAAALLAYFSPLTLAVFGGAAVYAWLCGEAIARAGSKARVVALFASLLMVAAVVAARLFLPVFGGIQVSLVEEVDHVAKLLGVAYLALRMHHYFRAVLYEPTARLHLCGVFGYFAYFPALLSGPLIRLREWREIHTGIPPGVVGGRRTDVWTDVESGTRRILWGLAKKAIAVRFCLWVAEVLQARYGVTAAPGVTAAMVMVVYLDFSGYCDIAVGVARLLGHRIRENFSSPFMATSLTHFWRGWHITMGDWLREHIFIPLGGMRAGKWQVVGLTLLVMLFCGVWHEFSLPFVLWGLYHGLLLAGERIFDVKPLPPQAALWKKLLRRLVVFALLCGSAAFFVKDYWTWL